MPGYGALKPPRKSTAATHETKIMFVYSAMKKNANRMPLYSVKKPATNSLSASGKSNGRRLVSATPEITKTTNARSCGAGRAKMYHFQNPPACASVIRTTTGEYDEWGDPNNKEYYDYILSYSPYDQVEAKDYPHLLVTTGLHDSQVQYWEPAKWVAKLRAMKTDSNRLVLKTNMDAGHGGASGRFMRFEEIAFRYAFLLDLAGKTNAGAGTD